MAGAAGGGTGGTTGGTSGSAGTGGEAAGAGGTGGSAGAGGSGGMSDPMLLSQTGLYADIASGTIAPDAFEFTPQFQLWSDSATKRRWVKLPPGMQINTADMDFWLYPNGTKFFKEFTRDGVLVETRMIMKRSPADWFMVAYKWRDDMMDADAVPAGEENARGTQHDIPSQEDCGTCHKSMIDFAIGFTAVQLAHSNGGLNLAQANTMGMLSAAPPAEPVVPGDPVAKAALGYMHANCGMCHHLRSKIWSNGTQIDMWLQVAKMGTVEATPAYTTLVDQDTTTELTALAKRIAPGDPAMSAVIDLMSTRGSEASMPPLGTEMTDTAGGLAELQAWITSLPPP